MGPDRQAHRRITTLTAASLISVTVHSIPLLTGHQGFTGLGR